MPTRLRKQFQPCWGLGRLKYNRQLVSRIFLLSTLVLKRIPTEPWQASSYRGAQPRSRKMFFSPHIQSPEKAFTRQLTEVGTLGPEVDTYHHHHHHHLSLSLSLSLCLSPQEFHTFQRFVQLRNRRYYYFISNLICTISVQRFN